MTKCIPINIHLPQIAWRCICHYQPAIYTEIREPSNAVTPIDVSAHMVISLSKYQGSYLSTGKYLRTLGTMH
jgi:hypothetical protein